MRTFQLLLCVLALIAIGFLLWDFDPRLGKAYVLFMFVRIVRPGE